ncbi:putative nuclease HARBI1 isoform X1, partial [Tanacetum coccineum]
ADPELENFRDTNLEMYHMYYDQLFRDSISVGDRTHRPTDLKKNNDSPSDSVEISFPESSSTKKKKKKNENNSNTCSKRGKTTRVSSSFELKLDTVLQTLSSRISQTLMTKNDSNEEDWMEDENTWLLICGLVVKGIIIGYNALNKKRLACRTSSRMGNIFIQEILNGHPRRCDEDFRLHVDVFRGLCSDLKEHYDLKATRNVSIEESVGIFLFILAHGCGNRLAQETFNHSRETIHRHFHKVLKAVLKLSGDIIKPNANYNEENCIGAIDGTHVRASVREHEQAKYIGRKGYATQNIMVACNFNMCFKFAWAGWEGTAHDTRIFLEVIPRPQVNFPCPTGDKYYVVDVGYPNIKGYLAPYKGNDIHYHIPDFRRGQTSAQRAPKGKKETFNYYHSSLRNVIERTFGVWKAR